MGLLFFPRGGSAQVVRYLSRSLPGAGWDVDASPAARWARRASSRTPAPSSRASTCTRSTTRASLEADDPVAADPPFHPSYEDRPGAPDRVFASVAEPEYERLVDAWAAPARAGRRGPRPTCCTCTT